MGGFMSVNYIEIEKIIDGSKVKYNEPMSRHTTLKVGGNADVLVIPENVEDVVNVLKFAKQNDIQVTVIGNGSKLLVLDKGIRGIVIKLASKFANVSVKGEYITVNAGMSLPRLAIIAKDNSLSGLEFAAGIPGNVGGAVYMNAGAYGSEMSNIIEEVTYIDDSLNVRTASNEECNFGYRKSLFRNNRSVILSTKLKLKSANKQDIEDLMRTNNEARKTKQPLEYPNAGSTFKRPEGYFVGKLIDDLGLKGYKIGDAEVSTKHAGFIVNKGNATANDVLELIKHITNEVKEKFDKEIKLEILIVGEK